MSYGGSPYTPPNFGLNLYQSPLIPQIPNYSSPLLQQSAQSYQFPFFPPMPEANINVSRTGAPSAPAAPAFDYGFGGIPSSGAPAGAPQFGGMSGIPPQGQTQTAATGVQPGMSNIEKIGLALVAAGILPGILGAFQRGGDTPGQQETAQTTVQPNVPPQSPAEQQLIAQLLGGAGGQGGQAGQMFFDTQTGQFVTAEQMMQLDPTEAQAALGGLGGAGGGNVDLSQFFGSPELNALVEQAFTPAFGDINRRAIEVARQQGFAGGAEVLQSPPGAAYAGPALADLQGQIAGAKLGTGTTLLDILQRGQLGRAELTQRGQLGAAELAQRDYLGQLSLLDLIQRGRLGGTGQTTTQAGKTTQLGYNPLLQGSSDYLKLLGAAGGAVGGLAALRPQKVPSINFYTGQTSLSGSK